MAIIDLGTGQKQAEEDQPQEQQAGRIIDLNTGEFKTATTEQQPTIEQPQLTEILPREQLEADQVGTQGPGFFESAGDFLSGITFDAAGDLFTGKSRETESSRGLPEIGSIGSGDLGADFKIAAGLLASANEEDQIDIIRDAIPGARFFRDDKQNVKITLPDGREAVLNQPGLSFQDAIQTTANILQFVPAGRFANLGKNLLQKVGLGAVAAGATAETAQQAARGLGATRELDELEATQAAAFGAAGEVVLPAIQAVRQARRARAIGAETEEVAKAVESIRPVTEAVEGLEGATGQRVGLFQAQQTQIPSELLKQRILPQLDAGARKAAQELELQNKDVFDATSSLINTIAPEGNIAGGAKRFRDAAQKSITDARRTRGRSVKPLYDEAFRVAEESGQSADLSPVIAFVNQELKGLVKDDPAAIALNSFVGRLKGEAVKGKAPGLIIDASGSPLIDAGEASVKPLSLKQLQSAKFTTDSQIDKLGGIVPSSATKNAKRLLSQAEKVYVDQLGKISPQFKAANDEFARLSPAINELEDSILGQAAKVTDKQLKSVAQTIFDTKAGLTDPEAIRKARKIINATDPEAWNSILRVELNRRVGGLEQLIEEIPGDFVGNIPGQLRRTLFGNPSQRKALLSGMNEEQKQNFKYLETVLKRASSGRAAGSPTAAFGQAIEKLKGVSSIVRDAIFRPLSTLQQTGERTIFDRNVAALTDVMFDPKFKPQLKKLKKLNQNSPASARALTQLLNSAAESREQEKQ